MNSPNAFPASPHVAFIGGGNMASAIIGGLLKQGHAAARIDVVEPLADQRAQLVQAFGVSVHANPDAALTRAELVVWAVKPQSFQQAAAQAKAHTGNAVHMSVAAGIRSSSIANWLDTEQIVRAMPNTPALIGQGMTALYARQAVTTLGRQWTEQVIQSTGKYLWMRTESDLDAVTALSGSGPAYVFYFLESMIAAGVQMGLAPAIAHQLAVATFTGASALAQASGEAPDVLRARVTSKGGTTHAALAVLEQAQVKPHFMQAMEAARMRAITLGDEFGAPGEAGA